jgi:polyphosphate kinase 2 (PPK2 family)
LAAAHAARRQLTLRIGSDDWRNRKKWDDYAQAANDMFARTSTGLAPWTLVQADKCPPKPTNADIFYSVGFCRHL